MGMITCIWGGERGGIVFAGFLLCLALGTGG